MQPAKIFLGNGGCTAMVTGDIDKQGEPLLPCITCRVLHRRGTICGRQLQCWEEFARQVRDEDVRALALEHEERASFGRGAATEADNFPGL